MIDNPAMRALRAHVSGKVESGEAEPIVERRAVPAIGNRIPIFDRHGGFTALTRSGTLWRPAYVLERVAPTETEMTVVTTELGRYFQLTEPVAWIDCKIKGYGYVVRAYIDQRTGERIA